jgi:lipopolysaccharide export system protein LptA
MSLIKMCIFFTFLLVSISAFALTSDVKEKVHIIADSSVFNFKKGMNLFEGHVKADQGTTHITAEKMTTKNNDKHEIEEIIAYGDKETAHYWTIPKLNDLAMHAYAKIIKFYPNKSNVILQNKVMVKQGENNFRGELVLYNMKEETIIMPPSANGRAILIYNPDK